MTEPDTPLSKVPAWRYQDLFLTLIVFFLAQLIGALAIGFLTGRLDPANESETLGLVDQAFSIVFGCAVTLAYVFRWILPNAAATPPSIGFTIPRQWPIESLLAIAGIPACLYVNYSVSQLFELIGVPTRLYEQTAFRGLSSDSNLDVTLFFFAAGIFGPIVEEVLFRGLAIEVLRTKIGTGPAFLFSSILFALVHTEAFVPLLILAFLLGWLYLRTRSLFAPILAHCLNNLFALYVLFYHDVPPG